MIQHLLSVLRPAFAAVRLTLYGTHSGKIQLYSVYPQTTA